MWSSDQQPRHFPHKFPIDIRRKKVCKINIWWAILHRLTCLHHLTNSAFPQNLFF